MSSCSASRVYGRCEPPPAFQLPVLGQARPRLYAHLNYVWSACGDWSEPVFYLAPLAFLSPLSLILLSPLRAPRRLARVLVWLEFVPLSFAGCMIYGVGWVIGEPLAGAYVGVTGVALLAAAWIGDVVGFVVAIKVSGGVRHWRSRRSVG